MKATGITDIGNVRTTNEDNLLISCELKPHYILVADGMGGHAAGEVASSIAASAIEEYIKKLNKQILDKNDIKQAVFAANQAIIERIASEPELKGMGTTLTFAAIEPDKVIVAHVGDSGAYLIDKNSVKKITKDHTYVQHLIDCGVIKTGAAEDYPFKNIITRALGMQNLEVDLYETEWTNGDAVLLCSDGLSGYVTKEHMMQTLREADNIEIAAKNLVEFALKSGGKDNITVVIAENSDVEEQLADD